MARRHLTWTAVIAAVAGLTATVGQAANLAMPPDLSRGPVRAWGGTEIRSLDPESAAWSAFSRMRPPQSPAPVSRRRPRGTVLSNERTFTRWAYVAAAAPIHQQPTRRSADVARLHWYTEDGFPETYLLLRTHWDTKGQEWIRVRIPMRPNGRTGWVRRQDLRRFHLTHTQITVDRARLRMYLSDNGRRIWSAPVAVGKASTPTPAGHFWIRERFQIADRSSGYWPYAFGTSDYSTLTDWPGGGVVGIHGPYYEPNDIPGRISHGCIRLRVRDDEWLAHHVGLGTPVEVS